MFYTPNLKFLEITLIEIELKMDWQGCNIFQIVKYCIYLVGEINTVFTLC